MTVHCDYQQIADDLYQCSRPDCGDIAKRRTRRVCGCRRREVPGRELQVILASVGLKRRSKDCCDWMAEKMNRWGCDGCRAHRAEIIEHLRKNYKQTTNTELFMAVGKAVATGLAFKVNPLDPFGSLVDEAIRRTEAASDL